LEETAYHLEGGGKERKEEEEEKPNWQMNLCGKDLTLEKIPPRALQYGETF